MEEPRIIDNRYVLLREIHHGRRCTVFQAQHLYTHRMVALKLLELELVPRELERESLLGEAKLLSEIRHVAIPEVLDAGTIPCSIPDIEQPFIVMEMINGRSLAGLLAARGSLEVPLAVLAAQALAAALRACHNVGLVHQDVRPANLLLPLERADRVPETRGAPLKLVDFDAANKSLLRGGEADDRAYHAYLAPEQQHGGAVDPRTDVFAVGVVLYQCLTGALPYPPDGSFAGPVPPPSTLAAGVPRRLDQAVMRAIEPNITARFKDMDQLLAALETALHAPPSSPPQSLVPPSTVATGASRRRFTRAAYLTPVRLVRGDGNTIDCTSEDISAGGMLLYGPRLLNDDEAIVARFALPISGNIIRAKAAARWHRSAHDGEGATGIEFTDLSDVAAQEIARYVEFFASDTT